MKKIFARILCICMALNMLGLTACGSLKDKIVGGWSMPSLGIGYTMEFTKDGKVMAYDISRVYNQGRYSVDGNTVTLISENYSTTQLENVKIDGDSLTLTWDGDIVVAHRID